MTAQREIEKAVRQGLAGGKLKGNEKFPAHATITLGDIGLSLELEGEITLEWGMKTGGRTPGVPNKFHSERAIAVEREGKRLPPANLLMIAENSMAMSLSLLTTVSTFCMFTALRPSTIHVAKLKPSPLAPY